ncbi:MAG: ABC transporter substrate-binding protein [Dactylosporangium sp.]|nr:ABC transporter substrate-binding protein [Dactylosporangium sp.]NNJ59621.1 ABC transporter substrate-binding protein [Dactylosporangium sp.]
MRARPARTATILALLGLVLLAASCGSSEPTDSSATASPLTAKLYGADANMSNSFGDALKDRPGALLGMKGTTPLTPLSADFKSRLLDVDPQLSHFNYTGETYDAVAIAAIAAEYAQTSDPATIAKHIVGATTGGTACATIANCLELARQGKDLQYRGIALRHSGLTDVGEPSSATYGTVSFARDNHIDDYRTEFVAVGDKKGQSTTPSPPPAKAKRNTGPLKIGGLLPHTGRLASFGPPLAAAAKLAVDEVNAAGGVLSSNVAWIDGDDGTNPEIALATVDKLAAQGVQVIIGAGASSTTKAVIPKIASISRILISPASTSDELTTAEDAGMFFRTAPPDTLQGKALADVIMRDGPRRVAIAALDETYGNGLSQTVQSNLLLAGLPAADVLRVTYAAKDTYDPAVDVGAIFNPLAADIKAFEPDAILIVGSDESSYLIRSLLTE